MTKKIALVLFSAAAVLLAAGCKKKEDKKEAPAVKEPVATKEPVPTPAPAPTPMTGQQLADAFIAHWNAWNAGDRAKFEANYDANVVTHRPESGMAPAAGPKGIADEAFMMKAGFPDGKGTPQLVLVNGRTVVGVVHLTGTNSAAMKSPGGEMPATNKKLGLMVFHAVTFNDQNKISDDWWIWDSNTFAHQMGMSPQPGRAVIETGAAQPVIAIAANNDVEKANLAAAVKGNEDFNKRDVAAMTAMWADDPIESDQVAPMDTKGKAEIEKNTKLFIGAFSDGKVAPAMTISAGDYVAQVATFTGTNDGDMGDMMKKTGKPVKMTVAEIMHFQGGKVKQLWRFWDSMEMAKQMGLIPDAPPAGAAPPAGTTPPAGAAPGSAAAPGSPPGGTADKKVP